MLDYGNTEPAVDAIPAPANSPAAAITPVVSKRQAILDQAQAGALPQPPDFSKPTHARFRAKLAQLPTRSTMACDINRLTRPLPSGNGWM